MGRRKLSRRRNTARGSSSKRKNVYLGKRVRDTGKPGLDNTREVKGIAKAIIKDYKARKISYRTAMSRMNLLELVVTRDSDFRGRKEAIARRIIDTYREKLKRLRKR